MLEEFDALSKKIFVDQIRMAMVLIEHPCYHPLHPDTTFWMPIQTASIQNRLLLCLSEVCIVKRRNGWNCWILTEPELIFLVIGWLPSCYVTSCVTLTSASSDGHTLTLTGLASFLPSSRTDRVLTSDVLSDKIGRMLSAVFLNLYQEIMLPYPETHLSSEVSSQFYSASFASQFYIRSVKIILNNLSNKANEIWSLTESLTSLVRQENHCSSSVAIEV